MELCEECGVMLTDYEIENCEGGCIDCYMEREMEDAE